MNNPIKTAWQAASPSFSQAIAPLSDALVTPLRSAFMAREPRERWLIVICTVFIVLFGWYKAIQQPLQQDYQRYSERNAQNAETLIWMRNTAAEIRAQGGAISSTTSSGSLLSIADSSLRSSGLSDAIQRIQPDDEKNVKIWLDNAKFNALLSWVAQMEKQGLVISVAGITPASGENKAGFTNARITLTRL